MSTKIYGIFSNQEIKEYDSVKNALNAGAIYSSTINENKKSDSSDIYEYVVEFYDSTSNSINLSYGNWKLQNRRLSFIKKLDYNMHERISVIDRFGQIDYLDIRANHKIGIIQRINDLLVELSSYNSWDEYNLKAEIEKLKREIEKLKSSIQS